MLVDNSLNLNELEAVRSSTNNREADRIQKFFNDIKNQKELILISDVYRLITALAASQALQGAALENNFNKILNILDLIAEKLNGKI